MRLAVHWIDDANPMDRWWPSSIRATGIGMEGAVVGHHRSPRATGPTSRTQKTKTEAGRFVVFRACRPYSSYVENGTKSCRMRRFYAAPGRQIGQSGPHRTKTCQHDDQRIVAPGLGNELSERIPRI